MAASIVAAPHALSVDATACCAAVLLKNRVSPLWFTVDANQIVQIHVAKIVHA